MANNAKDIALKIFAAGAAVLAIMYFSQASNTILDPIIQNETDKQKKKQAKKHVQEITGNKVLIVGKKYVNGTTKKPYYVNLTTLASQINDYWHGNFLNTHGLEARHAIVSIWPRHMARLAEIYEAQTGTPFLQDAVKYLPIVYQKQLAQYLNAI
jgi:hypothetical protein